MNHVRYISCLPLFILLFSLNTAHTATIEILSNMYTEEILPSACFERIKNSYEIRLIDLTHHFPVTMNYAHIKRYIVFNDPDNLKYLDDCPYDKKVLFIMEPVRISNEEAQHFSRIYTWDDDIIDNKKFFKFFFPDLLPMAHNLLPFEDKKLCTMVVRNWGAQHRGPVLEFFAKKTNEDFAFYGSPYPKLIYNKRYKGRIPGCNCGAEKINILKTYRFCLCFENATHLNGYISEKIFPCFAAGCVPVYWGAPNIEQYIPKNCFIDYRDFQSVEELYLFLKSMPKSVYEGYIHAIQQFLDSSQAHQFSPEHFSQTLYDAVTQEKGVHEYFHTKSI